MPSRVWVGKDQRGWDHQLGQTINQVKSPWLETLRELSCQKSGMQKSNFLQDLGYVEGAEGACCILHAMLQGSAKYPMSKASKETKTHIID